MRLALANTKAEAFTNKACAFRRVVMRNQVNAMSQGLARNTYNNIYLLAVMRLKCA